MSQIKNFDSGKEINESAADAEYIYIIEDQDVWFIDYIIGIAFKTPIDFISKHGVGGLVDSGRPYKEFYDIKDFQDYMEEKIGQEIDIESYQ